MNMQHAGAFEEVFSELVVCSCLNAKHPAGIFKTLLLLCLLLSFLLNILNFIRKVNLISLNPDPGVVFLSGPCVLDCSHFPAHTGWSCGRTGAHKGPPRVSVQHLQIDAHHTSSNMFLQPPGAARSSIPQPNNTCSTQGFL